MSASSGMFRRASRHPRWLRGGCTGPVIAAESAQAPEFPEAKSSSLVQGFSQGTLQLVGRGQASQQFLSATSILLGESEKRRGAVAEMAGGAAVTQDEYVVGVEIANHGAINQCGQSARNFFICAHDRCVGAAASDDRMLLERQDPLARRARRERTRWCPPGDVAQ
jgi:hypothetical protein